MNLNNKDIENEIEIFNKLIGQLDKNTYSNIKKKIDCFLHPKVSLFIPASGQCEYATKAGHTHPSYSFIYYFTPESSIVIEDKHILYDLSYGKCLSAMSPNIPHQEVVFDNFESYIAILIDADYFKNIMLQYVDDMPDFNGEAFVPHTELLGSLRCFMLEASENNIKNSELLNNLACVITHLIVRTVTYNTYKTMPLYDRFEVDRAIAYMNSHFSEKLTIEDIAEEVNLSVGHFSKIFKAVTGSTPINFLNMIRIKKARNMLINGNENMTEIALKCGFNTSSYFSACFIENYKTTPSAYRKNFICN